MALFENIDAKKIDHKKTKKEEKEIKKGVKELKKILQQPSD